MTNLLATISFVLVTNWETTSIEYPAPSRKLDMNGGLGVITLEYNATGYHQTGTILSNTIATVDWNGKKVELLLESTPIGTTNKVEWR